MKRALAAAVDRGVGGDAGQSAAGGHGVRAVTSRGAALLLASLLPVTSGCVAVAIPLAAGAALVKMRTGAERNDAKTSRVMEASASSDLKVTRVDLTELPPPDAPQSRGNSAVAAFRDYALAQLALEPGVKRPSALLTRPTDLSANRRVCSAPTSAVFVDLDPGRGSFDPLMPGRADPAFSAALAELRSRGIAVVWFSRLGGAFEAETRAALATAGLDPAGNDRLVLLRDLDERKQSRRDDVAKLVCPLAMIGDERADFDELYLYLKQPHAAFALDSMIGHGWFLASPFTTADQTAKDIVP